MDREDLPSLLAFSVVAEERNFRRAAGKLGVSPSALSHTMRRLEAKLGTMLLLRTTRHVAPTEAGERLLQTVRPALDEIDRGLHDLAGRNARVAGLIRINAHRAAADHLILPRLGELRLRHPELSIELSLEEGITDIVAAGFDAGVRKGKHLAADMIAVRISAEYRTAIVAAPSYFVGRSPPREPRDLQTHDCIAYRYVTSKTLHGWRFAGGKREIEAVLDYCLIVDDAYAVARAAAHGLGLGYVVRETVEDLLRSGVLVEVLADWSVAVEPDYLYYPKGRTRSPVMRAIVDHLRFAQDASAHGPKT